WRAGFRDGAWRVTSVDPNGPAAGVLAPGDRLLAIAGDSRAALVGPASRVRELPAGVPYDLRFERRGEERASRIALAAVPRTRAERAYLAPLRLLPFAVLATRP